MKLWGKIESLIQSQSIEENGSIEETKLLTRYTEDPDAVAGEPAGSRWNFLRKFATALFVLSYGMLFVLYIRTVQQGGRRAEGALFLGNEVIYEDAPADLASFPFSRAGFHRNDSSDPKTEFEGRPNPQNDAAWHRILNVGMIAISEEENGRLPNNGSASVRRNPEEHVVLLAMFHQLHCLKYLRDLIYDFDAGSIVAHDTDDYRVMHGDHCIDYLRQSLMCHGDLTPIIQEWQPTLHAYSAQQETFHQCRNFDKIWQWAAERNTTGLRADGRHEKHQIA